jgi:hypothetical protein
MGIQIRMDPRSLELLYLDTDPAIGMRVCFQVLNCTAVQKFPLSQVLIFIFSRIENELLHFKMSKKFKKDFA